MAEDLYQILGVSRDASKDEIKKAHGFILCDYMWCDIPLGRRRSPLSSYVYDGARFYCKAECAYMLENGVCQWGDFTLSLEATTHRPAKDVACKM